MVKPLAQAEPFWVDSARDIVKFLCLHVATAAGIPANRRNLKTVRSMLLAGDASGARIAALFEMGGGAEGHKLLFKEMQRNPAFGGLVARAGAWLAAVEKKADKTFFGALQTAVTNTAFLDSPQMARCVETSTFRLADLKADPGGVSVYVCLPFADYDIHGGWVRMMTTLAIGELQRSLARPASGHAVLMALDEFPSLGRLKSAEHAIAQIAGYGVKMLLVSQTLAQYQDAYRENWQTFLGNCGTKLFFGVDDLFTQSYVSQMMGEREVVRTAQSESKTWGSSSGTSYSSAHGATHSESWSVSMKGLDASRTHGGSVGFSSTTTYGRNESSSYSRGETTSEAIHKRPLMTTDEIAWRFSQEDRPAMLALLSGHRPLIVRRVRYFAWDWFRGRFDPAPGHPKPLTLKQLAAEAERRRLAEAERTRVGMEKARAVIAAHVARREAYEAAVRIENARLDRLERIQGMALFCVYRAAQGAAVLGALWAITLLR